MLNYKWTRVKPGCYECGVYTITRQTGQAQEVFWTLTYKDKVVAKYDNLREAKEQAERHVPGTWIDSDTAFANAQVVVRSALEANSVVIEKEEGKILFKVGNKLIASFCPQSQTTIWQNSAKKQQEAMIKAHVAFMSV